MRTTSWAFFVLGTAVAAAGCVRTIDPAGHTGPDGRYTGARALELDGNTGEATGVVTYPGGDRVDWKKIELPADTKGTLTLELAWRAPRAGLDLAFDVWSQWGDDLGGVASKKWNGKRKSARRAIARKDTTIVDAQGTVYVAVYASNRGDAGRYTLSATFTPEEKKFDPKFDEKLQQLLAAGKVAIPDPPRLALVFPPCGDEYDRSNPDCVENPPPCDRDKKDKNNPSCKHLCDEKNLDPKNPDCVQFYEKCTPETWVDPSVNPTCKDVDKPQGPVVEPIYLTIISAEKKDEKMWILFSVGKNSPIETGWAGSIVDSKQRPLKKGAFKVVKVKGGIGYATVDMSLDEVNRNLDVVVYPPGQ